MTSSERRIICAVKCDMAAHGHLRSKVVDLCSNQKRLCDLIVTLALSRPFLRYGGLLVEDRQFSVVSSHLAPSIAVTVFGFWETLKILIVESIRGVDSEDFVILARAVLAQYSSVTFRHPETYLR